MWKNLKDKIKAMLEASGLFQQVFVYEPTNFGGNPVAVILPSINESDYRTTAENSRVYAFSIKLLAKLGQPKDLETVEDTLTDLVDSVLDDFDKYYTLGTGSPGSDLVLPTGYTMVRVYATPSSWFYEERETTYRVAEVQLRVEMDINVSQIS